MRRMIQEIIEEKVEAITDVDNRPFIILGVGVATFFFGFAAGAILNFYLIAIESPLILHLRSSLGYASAIFGDGLILPLTNMVVAAFLLKHKQMVGAKTRHSALVLGAMITLFFHINQAVSGLVNWAMPTPWHWNILGVWHALYMLSVASFISCFYVVLLKVMKHRKHFPREAVWVTLGLALFFILLRLDYIAVNLSSLFPRF